MLLAPRIILAVPQNLLKWINVRHPYIEGECMTNEKFLEEKRQIHEWLSGHTKAWGGLEQPLPDQNISTLIANLNKLPFLYTVGSCGGHVRKRMGRVFFDAGWFTFRIDNTAANTQFLQKIQEIIREFDGTDFRILKSGAYAVNLAQSEYDTTEQQAHYSYTRIQELISTINALCDI